MGAQKFSRHGFRAMQPKYVFDSNISFHNFIMLDNKFLKKEALIFLDPRFLDCRDAVSLSKIHPPG